jgi:hypothetical protein
MDFDLKRLPGYQIGFTILDAYSFWSAIGFFVVININQIDLKM